MKENYLVQIEDPRFVDTVDLTKMPRVGLQRTPWYSPLANISYCDEFFYFGAHIPEREKLIIDGDDEEGNDCEQSDLVNILLNLGSIPDEVAQKFDFKAGFTKEFVKSMKQYQEDFQKEHEVKWDYMNERTINQYLTWKELQDDKHNDKMQSTRRTKIGLRKNQS